MMTRQRHIAVTVATGAIAVMTAILVFGAPPIPVAIGAIIAVAWLIRRGPIF